MVVVPLTVPAPATVSPRDVMSAGWLNTNIRDAVNYLLSPPFAVLSQATAQSLPNGAWTPVTLDASAIDNYSGHSTVTVATTTQNIPNSTYYAPIAGWYHVIGCCGFVANGAGGRVVDLMVNGYTAQREAVTPNISINTIVQVEAFVYLGVASGVWVNALQSSGGALSSITQASSLQMRWLHA